MRVARFLIISLVSLLGACGGGLSGDDNDNIDPAVLVNAGINLQVDEGTLVELAGVVSGQSDSFRYAWQAQPSLVINHPDATSSAATFTAPTTTSKVVYTLTLTATNDNNQSASDSLEVTVLPLNALPVPNINAYLLLDNSQPAQYPAGVVVELDGSASSDSDSPTGSDAIAEYQWQQTAGSAVLGGVSLDGDKLQFTTPVAEDGQTLTFSLTVTDQEGASATDSLSINVLSQADTLPVISAGVDHQVFVGESILLVGRASSSVPAALPLQYRWLPDSTLNTAIDNANAVQTFAVAPEVTESQQLSFTLQVTDQFGNQVQDSLQVRVRPLPLRPLNDTGVLLQASNTQIDAGFKGGFPGQDAQRGQDIIAHNGLLEKAGRGDQGFDFTRLDNVGDEQDDVSAPWRCVRDNVTGLVWEVKSADASTHSGEHTYSWYFAENNGGFSGHQSVPEAACTLAQCNTSAYIAAVNAAGLCGFYDWRLPTHSELLSLMHYGNTASPMIDTGYFPNAAVGAAGDLWYWVRQASVDGINSDSESAQNAWVINFANGNDNFLNKASAVRVRLVRAGRNQ